MLECIEGQKRPRTTVDQQAQSGAPMIVPSNRAQNVPSAMWDSYEHSTKQKALIRKTGHTLQRKSSRFGKEGHTLCVLIYRNPTRRTWVCAAHVPEGQDVPDLNGIVRLLQHILFHLRLIQESWSIISNATNHRDPCQCHWNLMKRSVVSRSAQMGNNMKLRST